MMGSEYHAIVFDKIFVGKTEVLKLPYGRVAFQSLKLAGRRLSGASKHVYFSTITITDKVRVITG